MDGPQRLLVRNAELETELRFIKEQLAQANNANHYLLKSISSNTDTSRLERKYEQVVRENAQLKTTLQLTGCRAYFELNGITSRAASTAGYTHCDSNPDYAHDSLLEQKDLLSSDFEEGHEAHALAPSPLLVDTDAADLSPSPLPLASKPCAGRPHHGPSIGLGISSLSATTPNVRGFSFIDADGNPGLLPTPPTRTPKTDPDAEVPHSRPAYFRKPLQFATFEHNRISGAACFVEAMTEEEQAEHWIHYAKEYPRHSAAEYKIYYEEFIRPAYLKKMNERSKEDTPQSANQSFATSTPQSKNDIFTPSSSFTVDGEDGREGDHTHLATDRRLYSFGGKPPTEIVKCEPEKLAVSEHVDMQALGHQETSKEVGQTETPDPISMGNQEQAQFQDESAARPLAAAATMEINPAHERRHESSMEEQFRARFTASTPPAPNLDVHRAKAAETRPQHSFGPGFAGRANASPRDIYPADVNELFVQSPDGDRRAFRTVLITNIPPNVNLGDVLAKVKGGKIVCATYLETAGMQTEPYMETNTALVMFLHHFQAKKFVDSCRQKFVFYYSEEWQAPFKATVKLIDTPSRPLHPLLLRDVKELNLSRVLFIHNAPAEWTPDLVVERIRRWNSFIKLPLKAGYDKDGIMTLEFASMAEAKAAWAVVDRDYSFFQGVSKGFVADPCELPAEASLIGQAMPAPAAGGEAVSDEDQEDSDLD